MDFHLYYSKDSSQKQPHSEIYKCAAFFWVIWITHPLLGLKSLQKNGQGA